MKPIIVIVGRPNVGKSTLYNRLTRSRDALVDDQPGVTRDRLFGTGRYGEQSYWVVDTGGMITEVDPLHRLLQDQIDAAVSESDAIIFMMDGREGPNALDQEIAEYLRLRGRPVFLAVNKTEGLDKEQVVAEFFEFGMGTPYPISARTGTGVRALLDSVLADRQGSGPGEALDQVPRFAIMGRPNVGKSTLANALLGETRMVVFDQPGTTRDCVEVPLELEGRDFILVDTAGLRRQSKIVERLEHFATLKTLRVLERVHVVVLILDAQQGVVEQDTRLAGLVWSSGRSLVLVINKWDHLSGAQRRRVRLDVQRKLRFLDGVEPLFVSARYGGGLGGVLPAIVAAYDAAVASLPTPQLNEALREAVRSVPPPIVGNRRIRLKYAHQGGKNPPLVVIHGNAARKIPESYLRFLSKRFRNRFGLQGTPVRIALKRAANPYENKNP